MWSRVLLLALVLVALAAFACQPEPLDGPAAGAAEAKALGLPPPPTPEPEPEARPVVDRVDAEAPLGLFTPIVPGLGLDTHSSECDPFEDDSEICL